MAFVLALSLGAQPAWALGLGKLSGTAHLGHPLDLAVALRLDAHESLEPACVAAEVTAGDRVLPRQAVRARPERVAGSGERRIRLSTTVAIDEPVVAIQLSVGCPARLIQSYVVFADPPNQLPQLGLPPAEDEGVRVESGAAAAVAAAAVGSSGASTLPTGLRSAARSGTGAQGRGSVSGQNDALRTTTLRATAGANAGAIPLANTGVGTGTGANNQTKTPPRAAATRAVEPRRRTGGAVLQLDPIDSDALVTPRLTMSTTLSASSAHSGPHASGPSSWLNPEYAAQTDALARLRNLEGSVLQLRQDSVAKDKAIAAAQARWREAEAARYANPLVVALSALSGLLVLALLVMIWLRHRDRRLAEGWAALAHQQMAAEVAVAPDANHPAAIETGGGLAMSAADSPLGQGDEEPPLAYAQAEPMPLRAETFATPFVMASADTSAPAPEPELRRPMSAEELIDLEQQVDFFVVLGQDEAAIDLLMAHVRSTGGVSPLPYLKLLEIYRRRNEPEPYERIRERFNRRFNAYTPEWGVDPESGKTLDGYPEVLARLQATWPASGEALVLLDTLLFRRDAGPAFDVPAYRELLFLFGTARDLAERDVSADGVDLLLPDFEESDFSHGLLTAHDANAPLDLDVSTDHPPLRTIEELSPNNAPVHLDFILGETHTGTGTGKS